MSLSKKHPFPNFRIILPQGGSQREILQNVIWRELNRSIHILGSRVNLIEIHNTELLRSVIEINPDALEIGDACDKERAAGIVRGPLHGIPFLVKDVRVVFFDRDRY